MKLSHSDNYRVLHRLVLVTLLVLSSSIPAPTDAADNLQVIGQVAMTKGVVTARSDSRSVVSLAKGSPVYLNDMVETATRSFAVIKFNDGGKITLRPESRIDLNEYNDTAGQEKESFELIKGGLRAVTGAIGKARPEQVKYTARDTTIGIRGTTLVIRLCNEGDDGCDVTDAAQGRTEIESEKKYVDIFIVDQKGGSRQRISRKQLDALLQGVYVSVIDGAIRVFTASRIIDMAAGDKCVIEFSDVDQTLQPGRPGVDCFVPGPGLEDNDVFLGPDAEKITLFNLFDDSEIDVGNEICEID
ncbi:MAG: FecR domain-containing protein [Gammaproteobacteria bacterium]|nr:FecR domain-containing protein [Gammaproteobacteria bacterium]